MKISVIIPFLNESANLLALETILNNYVTSVSFKLELIFVDDGSTDDSVEILSKYNRNLYHIKIVKLSKNYGSHSALRAGLLNATGEKILFLYADMQDPIELIGELNKKIDQDKLDIVWANRMENDSPFFDKLFSRFYSGLMSKYAIKNYPLKGFDVVMFTNKVLRHLNKDVQINSSIFLQLLSFGFKQGNIEYKKEKRQHGQSKWTIGKKIKLFIDSFVAFSFAPIRFVTIMGLIIFFIGVVFSMYLIVRKFLYHDLVSGWTMLMTVLSLGFGITNISLGIIAEYLWRTFDAARNRPAFIIDEIIELN